MSRFWSWATLENVGNVVDLALKLAAIVAVLAVLSFFTGGSSSAGGPWASAPPLRDEEEAEPMPRAFVAVGADGHSGAHSGAQFAGNSTALDATHTA